MKTITTLLAILMLTVSQVSAAQPAPIGNLVITENTLRAAEVPSNQVSTQMVSTTRTSQRAMAAMGLGFFGLLVGAWIGQAVGGGGERGVPGALVGASVGVLTGVIIALK